MGTKNVDQRMQPMSRDLDTARRYRSRAAELRVMATAADTRSIKPSLLQIADEYDRLAASLETIDMTNQKLRVDR